MCRSGGIGRRSRLKICRMQIRAGSSPAFGTTVKSRLPRNRKPFCFTPKSAICLHFVCTWNNTPHHETTPSQFLPFFWGQSGEWGILPLFGNFRHKNIRAARLFFECGHTDYFFIRAPCGFQVSGHPACRRTCPW